MKRFIGKFMREISLDSLNSGEWVESSGLYKLLANWIFRAEVEALYGKHIFRICPSFVGNFWSFHNTFPRTAMKLP